MIRWLLAAALATAPVAAMAQPQPKAASLETRMERVEANLAIQHILVDYAVAFDSRNYDAYVALFTPDGEWTNEAGSHKGQPAIRAMLDKFGPAGVKTSTDYHIMTNPRIDVIDADHARSTSRFLYMVRGTGGAPTPSLAGIYHDDFVRVNGAWKIKRRVAEDIMPSPEDWQKIHAAQQSQQAPK